MKSEILSWEQIKKQYPHQNVGMIDIQYATPQGGAILSARVICTDKDTEYNEMALQAIQGKIVVRYTTLDEDIIEVKDERIKY